MVISRQVAYFDGSLESVLGAVLLDFPPQFSIIFSPGENILRGHLEVLADILHFEHYDIVEIKHEVPDPSDSIRRIGLASGIAEYVYYANVLHVPVARHTLLDAGRRRVHKFAYAEGEAARRSEEGFFRISTPLASRALNGYVGIVIRRMKQNQIVFDFKRFADAVKKSIALSCLDSCDILKVPCGECEPCCWNFAALQLHDEFKIPFRADPKESEAMRQLLLMNKFDDLTRKELEKCRIL